MGWQGEAALGSAPQGARPVDSGCAPCPSSEPNQAAAQQADRHKNQSKGFLAGNRLGVQIL